MNEQEKVIGIIGGMGPEAGVNLQSKINTAARKIVKTQKDKDYPSVMHFSYPSHIPDRTEFLLGITESNPAFPVAQMTKRISEIAQTNDEFVLLLIPCNTFHAKPIWHTYMEEVTGLPNINIVNLIDETVEMINTSVSKKTKLAILGTIGTHKEKIYESELKPLGYEIQELTPNQQKDIHKAIYDHDFGLKATSRATDSACNLINSVVKLLKEQGVERIILGSTELSLAFCNIKDELYIDPLTIVAEKLVHLSQE